MTPFDPVAVLGVAGLVDVASPRGAHASITARVRQAGAPLVWVQDAATRLELGGLHIHGLARSAMIDPSRLIVVRARRPVDALWAMEEALQANLPVVGEIEGDPSVLNFTATRRLEMRARAAGVPCALVRVGTRVGCGSSGARYRWCVTPYPSASDPYDARAPGRRRWVLELVRARDRAPGAWVVEATPNDEQPDGFDGAGTSYHLRVVAALAGGGVATNPYARDHGKGRGNIVPLRPGRAA